MLNNYNEAEIETLLLAIKNRNQEQFGECYDRYAPFLYGWILRSEPDRKMAEEKLLKTFLRIWNDVAQYNKDKSSFLIWMIQQCEKEI